MAWASLTPSWDPGVMQTRSQPVPALGEFTECPCVALLGPSRGPHGFLWGWVEPGNAAWTHTPHTPLGGDLLGKMPALAPLQTWRTAHPQRLALKSPSLQSHTFRAQNCGQGPVGYSSHPLAGLEHPRDAICSSLERLPGTLLRDTDRCFHFPGTESPQSRWPSCWELLLLSGALFLFHMLFPSCFLFLSQLYDSL